MTARRVLSGLRLEHRVALRGLAEHAAAALTAPLRLVLRRDPTLVAMGAARDRFADNAAHLFLHLSRAGDAQVRPVWVSGSRAVVSRLRAQGHRAELRWSPAGVLAALRAGTFVYSSFPSDINAWLMRGARTVCLWHGLPLKRVERLLTAGSDGALARLATALRPPPDYLLSSTETVSRRCLAPAFGVPIERCWHHGYPRNDVLMVADQAPDPAFAAEATWRALQGAERVVGLFLTWREGRVSDMADESLVARLAETCGRHGALLLHKPHYNVVGSRAPHPNCVVLPPEADLNTHLRSCDILVTDYSAVVFDVLLLGMPVLRYQPDLDAYRRDPGFCYPPEELPGTPCPDRETLVAELDTLLGTRDLPGPGDRGAALRREVWGAYDGRACEAIRLSLGRLATERRRRGGFRGPRDRVT